MKGRKVKEKKENKMKREVARGAVMGDDGLNVSPSLPSLLLSSFLFCPLLFSAILNFLVA